MRGRETAASQQGRHAHDAQARSPAFWDQQKRAPVFAFEAKPRGSEGRLNLSQNAVGKEKIGHLDRQKLIDYGKMRAEQGAGPVTLGIDIGVIKMIITHAAAVHGLDISPEPVDLARVALKRLGLIGKGTERDRRPHDG